MAEPPGHTATLLGITGAWLRRAAAEVHERRQWLTELDAAIGDGDHGINLDRGLVAVRADLDAGRLGQGDAATLLGGAGRRLLGLVGGASGALYGRGLMAAGEAVRDRVEGEGVDPRELVQVALDGAVAGMSALGRAVPGDKTMLDALVPALIVLRQAPPGEPVELVMRRMADAADAGAAATVPLVARKGRASYLGERSAGHLDPGAASSAILVRCLAEAVIGAGGQPSVRRET